MGLVCAKNASEKFSRLGTFKAASVGDIYVTLWWSLYELSFKEVSVCYNKLIGAFYELTF